MASIGFRPLAELCRRSGTAYGAGVDIRTIWQREAANGSGRHQRHMQTISEAINRGSSLADAIDLTHGYLPVLMHDMVEVGEQTGKMDAALFRLARYYEEMITRKRAFLVSIAWPMFEFVVAISVIGLGIALLGFVSEENREFLGVNFWVGTKGLAVYLSILAAIIIPIILFIRGAMIGQLPSPFMAILMRVPKLGKMLRLMALSRMTWTLGMAVDSGMGVKQCVDIALRSTQNTFFTRHSGKIQQSIAKGEEMNVAFAKTGAFPREFLDAVTIGEDTGRLTESMDTLSQRYEEDGKLAMWAMSMAGGVLVTMLVGAVIIFFIFALANGYKNMLENAMEI